MKFDYKKLNKGTTVLEVIFYIAIFAMLSLVIVESSIILTRSFRTTKVNLELSSAGAIMERMVREIRQSQNITTISSNSLKLDNGDPSQAITSSIQFSLINGHVVLYENDIIVGSLNPSNITVNDLQFTEINTDVGTAVKIYMQVSSNHFNSVKTVDYYDTVVLRGDY